MTYTLSILDPASLPVSKLEETEQLCAADLFALERTEEQFDRMPILQEQHPTSSTGDDVISAVLLELGIDSENVSQIFLNEMKISLGTYLHYNFKIQYDQLSARLLHDLSNALSLGTMAWKDRWEYAKSTHTHKGVYSNVKCHAVYTKEQIVATGAPDSDDITQMSGWLGTAVIHQLRGSNYVPISTDIFYPNFVFKQFSAPDIGEVRFMGWRSFPESTMVNGTEMIFDVYNGGYWVYPRGQTIQCGADQFKDACRVFAGDERATSFTVKDFQDFIRLNPRAERENPCKKIQWQNEFIGHHRHIVQKGEQAENQSLSGEAIVKCGTVGSGTTIKETYYLHNGDKTNYKYKGSTAFLDVSGSQSFTRSAEDQESGESNLNVETKPKSIDVPAILYIGGI